jgi:hypothetical protein
MSCFDTALMALQDHVLHDQLLHDDDSERTAIERAATLCESLGLSFPRILTRKSFFFQRRRERRRSGAFD